MRFTALILILVIGSGIAIGHYNASRACYATFSDLMEPK